MSYLLIITVLFVGSDGALMRQRDMIVQNSKEACAIEALKRMEEQGKTDGPTRTVVINCVPTSTLEVVKPAPNKNAPPLILKPERGA